MSAPVVGGGVKGGAELAPEEALVVFQTPTRVGSPSEWKLSMGWVPPPLTTSQLRTSCGLVSPSGQSWGVHKLLRSVGMTWRLSRSDHCRKKSQCLKKLRNKRISVAMCSNLTIKTYDIYVNNKIIIEAKFVTTGWKLDMPYYHVAIIREEADKTLNAVFSKQWFCRLTSLVWSQQYMDGFWDRWMTVSGDFKSRNVTSNFVF